MVGDTVGSFIVRNIPLFPENIELFNRFGIRTQGQAQRVDYTVVMIRALRLVTAGGKCGCSELQGSIVGDVKAPIIVEARSLRCREVAVDHGHEFCDFVEVGLVRLQPTELLPLFQAHAHLQ